MNEDEVNTFSSFSDLLGDIVEIVTLAIGRTKNEAMWEMQTQRDEASNHPLQANMGFRYDGFAALLRQNSKRGLESADIQEGKHRTAPSATDNCESESDSESVCQPILDAVFFYELMHNTDCQSILEVRLTSS